jgi:DNA-binding XRE family transcriptional regulator
VDTPDTARKIGDAIRAARVRAHLTQAELGAFVGVDRFTIARLEKGNFTAQGRRLFAVLDAVGMAIEVVPRSRRSSAAERRADGTTTTGAAERADRAR